MVLRVKHMLFKCMVLNLNPQNHIVHLSNSSPPVLKQENLQISWVSSKSGDLDSSKVKKEPTPEIVLCPLCLLWPPSSYHGNIHSAPHHHTQISKKKFFNKKLRSLGIRASRGLYSFSHQWGRQLERTWALNEEMSLRDEAPAESVCWSWTLGPKSVPHGC